MILLLCLIVVAAALSIIALALYEGTASPPGTPVAAMAAERVAAEPVQWQVAPEKAGEVAEDSDSREADGGEAGGYVMASFKQGKAMGDGLRLLHSQDALRWEALPPSGKAVLAWTEVEGASVFRDPSMVWDRGLFHLVFTAELCVHQEREEHRRTSLRSKGWELSVFCLGGRQVALPPLRPGRGGWRRAAAQPALRLRAVSRLALLDGREAGRGAVAGRVLAVNGVWSQLWP